MRLHLLEVLTLLLISCNNNQDSTRKWQSVYRNLSFTYEKHWTLMPTLDTKEKTLTGVIDNRDGKSLIIQISDDISKDRLTDRQYLDGTKKIMLQANSKNRIISEDTLPFHGAPAYRQIYLMYTAPWGLLKQINFIVRNGVEFISVQMLFPTTEDEAESDYIPVEVLRFDDGLKISSK